MKGKAVCEKRYLCAAGSANEPENRRISRKFSNKRPPNAEFVLPVAALFTHSFWRRFYNMFFDLLRMDFFNLAKRFFSLYGWIFVTPASSIFMDLTSETSFSCGFNGKITEFICKTSNSPFILLNSPENKTLVLFGKRFS